MLVILKYMLRLMRFELQRIKYIHKTKNKKIFIFEGKTPRNNIKSNIFTLNDGGKVVTL